jgi:copper resistance protein B
MRRSGIGAVLMFEFLGNIGCTTVAQAQSTPDPNAAAPFGAPMDDQQVFVHAQLDQLELRAGDGVGSFRWDGEAWAGTDTNRLVIKSEGFVTAGTVEDGEHELLYAHPISTFFDLQAGVRYDLDSLPSRGWAAVGIEGLAPYFFKVSATAYASAAGRFAAKVTGSWEAPLTQRLILEPQIELNAYSRPDAARDVAAGLSDMDAGVRLRYEVRRKFAPYLGVTYERLLVNTEHISGLRAAAGFRLWL